VRISVEPGSELDRAIAKAEGSGESVEVVRGNRTYALQLLSGRVLTEEELAWRKALVERTRALRDSQSPLGISTDELIRQVRAERYGE